MHDELYDPPRTRLARGRWALCLIVIGLGCGNIDGRQAGLTYAAPSPESAQFLQRIDDAMSRAVARIRAWWADRARSGPKFRFHVGTTVDPRVGFGLDALAALAVLHGLDRRPFDELPALLEEIRRKWRAADGTTYGASLALMFLSEAKRQADAEAAGEWAVPGGGRLRRLPAWLEREALEMARAIARWRTVGSGWSYGAGFGGPSDISNMGFAMRALLEARRFGFKVSATEANEIRDATLALQWTTGDAVPLEVAARPTLAGSEYADPGAISTRDAKERGFHYKPYRQTSVSTTTSALIVLASLRSIETTRAEGKPFDARSMDVSIRDGLAWMSKRHVPGKNVEIVRGDDQLHWGLTGLSAGAIDVSDNGMWGTLVLWNLSQLMELLHIDGSCGADWYREGAEYLLRAQRKDGSWNLDGRVLSNGMGDAPMGAGVMNGMGEADTGFALLFLHRARLRYGYEGDQDRGRGPAPVTPK